MENLSPLVTKVLKQLHKHGAWLATAESCTGGLIANSLTDVPGSSQSFWGGIVCYANSAKEHLLHVPASLIENHGAVSQEVAQSLAHGAITLLASHLPKNLTNTAPLLAISTTGIAGPDGATPSKDVGTCCLGLAIKSTDGSIHLKGKAIRAPRDLTREENKHYFAMQALLWIHEELGHL